MSGRVDLDSPCLSGAGIHSSWVYSLRSFWLSAMQAAALCPIAIH